MKILYDLLKENGADGYIVLNKSDVRYFSGLISSNIALLITLDESYVFSDARYKYRIESQNKFIPVVCEKNILEELKQTALKKGLSHILIDPTDISCAQYLKYFSDMDEKIMLKNEISKDMRSVKSSYETDSVIKAQRIAENALSYILPVITEGMTTAEICARLEYQMKILGSEEPAFETIVLSGAGTADCHGIPDNTPVKDGELILFDFGATVNGYRSDMTRTYAFKSITDKQAEVYDTVLKAHYAAAEKIKSGIPAFEVDKAARDIISEKGYKDYFLHSTGHGVGLDIHEFPGISHKSEAILKKGMIITDEPGIYLKNEFGIRIEDMYLVDDNKGISLAQTEKKLTILK